MATFNPEVQNQNAPSYNFSQPTGRYDSHWSMIPTTDRGTQAVDKSTGIALEGAGNFLKMAVTGADEVIKKIIDEAIYKGVDKERDAMTGALEEIGGVPQSQRVSDSFPDNSYQQAALSDKTSAPELIPGSVAEPIPGELEDSVTTAENMNNSARVGRIPNTYYSGRLAMLQKDLRSQWPGYRQYIDTRMSAITGGNPANEYMRNLLAGISSSSKASQSITQKALAVIEKNAGVPGAPALAAAISSGRIADPYVAAITWEHDWKSVDVQNQRTLQQLSLFKGTQEQKVAKAEEGASATAMGISRNVWNQTIQSLGKSWNDISQMSPDELKKWAGGNSEGMVQIGQNLTLAARNIEAIVQQKLNEPGPNGGPSQAEILGKAKTEAIVQNSSFAFRTLAGNFISGDVAAAKWNAQVNDAIVDDASNWLLKQSELKDTAAVYAAAAKQLGPAAAAVLPPNTYLNMSKTVEAYTGYQKQRLISDPNARVSNIIDDMRKKGEESGSKTKQDELGPGYKNILDTARLIGDSRVNDGAKINLVTTMFGSGNEGLINKFADDSFNAKGELIPGKHSILRDMTTPEITAEIWRLNQIKPGTWDIYKNWVDQSVTKLIKTDIDNLNKAVINPNMVVKWDTEKHQLAIDFKDTFFRNPYNVGKSTKIQDAQAESYRRDIAKINTAIGPLIRMAEKEGGDVNAKLLNYMVHGLRLDPAGVGMPSEILKAIIGKPSIQSASDRAAESAVEAAGTLDPTRFDNKPTQAAKTPRQPELKGPSYLDKPGTAFNESLQRFRQNYIVPVLEDWTKSKVGAAEGNQIKGTANAAHISEEWGNPLSPDFHDKHITTIKTPSGQDVNVNTKAAKAFEGFLKDLEDTGYKVESVGGYNLRTSKNNPRSLSQHAFGNAIDINPGRNPFLPGAKKAQTDLPANISDIAAKWGISWGGDWKNIKDAMHFEYTGRTPKKGEPGYKLAEKK